MHTCACKIKFGGGVVIYGVPLGPLGGRTFIIRVNLKFARVRSCEGEEAIVESPGAETFWNVHPNFSHRIAGIS